MSATNAASPGSSLKNKVFIIALLAASGMWDARGIDPDTRMLSTEWLLLHRLLLAVLCGAFLFNKGWDRPVVPSTRGVLVHALAATAVLLPFGLGAAPELLETPWGVASIAVMSGLLGLTAATLYSVVLGTWRRIPNAERHTRSAGIVVIALFLTVLAGGRWFASHRFEGPAIVLRPVAQALGSTSSPLLAILGLALMSGALLGAHRLVPAPSTEA